MDNKPHDPEFEQNPEANKATSDQARGVYDRISLQTNQHLDSRVEAEVFAYGPVRDGIKSAEILAGEMGAAIRAKSVFTPDAPPSEMYSQMRVEISLREEPVVGSEVAYQMRPGTEGEVAKVEITLYGDLGTDDPDRGGLTVENMLTYTVSRTGDHYALQRDSKVDDISQRQEEIEKGNNYMDATKISTIQTVGEDVPVSKEEADALAAILDLPYNDQLPEFK